MSAERFKNLLSPPELESTRQYLTQEDLRAYLPGSFNEVGIDEFLLDPTLIDFQQLLVLLQTANDVIFDTPGPHQNQRQKLVGGWLWYWQELVKSVEIQSYHPNSFYQRLPNKKAQLSRAVPFELLKTEIDRFSWITGVLFVAGAEGHEGHRFAVEYMSQQAQVSPILIFEPDNNFQALNKARGLPLIPLPYRLAMWSYFSDIFRMTVCPTYPDDLVLPGGLDSFYQKVFNDTGALRCFAHQLDPHRETKIRRGEYQPTNIIPDYPAEPTTSRVYKLLGQSEGGDEELLTILDQFVRTEIYPKDYLSSEIQQRVGFEIDLSLL